MERLLNIDLPPTAVFATSDTQALGALRAIHESGRQVPNDVALVGYDDIEVSEYVGLSTVRQPMFQMGQEGVQLLLAQLNDESDEHALAHRNLPVEMVVRETSSSAGFRGTN
jgi:DNA-binding LacI/PurR family transcriptional regulator